MNGALFLGLEPFSAWNTSQAAERGLKEILPLTDAIHVRLCCTEKLYMMYRDSNDAWASS
jgi:hypothetical protein